MDEIQPTRSTHETPTSKRLTLLNRREKTIWDDTPGQKTTSTTLWGTMDWSLEAASLLFILFSSLLIANGSCSQPEGFSATSPVCVGGRLSIETWLAIIGLEFGVLGFIVVPRVQAVLVSKMLSSRLMHDGLSLAKVLNSQTTAPTLTQLRLGMRSILFLRIFVLIAVTTVSILYKFSFARVSDFDTIGLMDRTLPVLMGADNGGTYNGISTNLLDALSSNSTPSSFNTSFSPATKNSTKHYEQIFGPSQVNVAHQLDDGNLYLCTPTYYSRNTVIPNVQNWTTLPILTKMPYNHGIRYTNPANGTIIDIFSLNGTLYILTGSISTSSTARYTSLISSTIQVCLGYVSWSINNTSSRTSLLQNPTDIACVPEPFDFINWRNASSTQFTRALLAGIGSSTKSITNLPTETAMLNVLLATINHTDSRTRLEARHKSAITNKEPPQAPQACSLASASPSQPWVISGTIPLHATGMTLLGAALQGLVLLFSFLTLILLFWPSLPLVGEWSAQWLGLVGGLSPAEVREAVEGTSLGGNEVSGEGWVWLGSKGGDVLEGRPGLVVGAERGRVRMGRAHV